MASTALGDHEDDDRNAGKNCADGALGEHAEADRNRHQIERGQAGFQARGGAGRGRVAGHPPQKCEQGERLEEAQRHVDAAVAALADVLIGAGEGESGEDGGVDAEEFEREQHREDRAGNRVKCGWEAEVGGGHFADSGEAIDCDRGPMEQRRLVHRDDAVLDREQELAVLDHLLDEHAFDRLVAGAYVAGAEPMKRQDGGEESDRGDRGGRFQVHAKAIGLDAEI